MGAGRRHPRECVKAVAQLIARCKLVDARQRPSARECYDILMATPDSLCGGPGPCVVLVVLVLEPELSCRSPVHACPALCMAVRRLCGRASSASAALMIAEPVGSIIVFTQYGGRASYRASCRLVVEPRRAQAPHVAPSVLETVAFALLSLS
jgi:hypothetical protein